MDKEKLLAQMRRIEGQVRGVARMIESERGLVPTMQQLMAVSAALARARREYVGLFLRYEQEGDGVRLTKEQIEYILRLID